MADEAESQLQKAEELLAEVQKRGWAGLPNDLLRLVIANLFLDDVKRFHNVCRAWKSTPIPSVQSPIKFPAVPSQWLMCIENDTGRSKFFHPVYNEPYAMEIPELSGAILRFSKDSWLLMSRGERSIFFFNPFTKATISLPDLPVLYDFKAMTFTSSPTLPDSLVFGISCYGDKVSSITTIRRGEESWQVHHVTDDYLPIFISDCNPVFHEGKFYCLGRDGNFGVFDPENGRWRVRENPREPQCDSEVDRNFLVESDGELFSVFVGFMGEWISVFRLDDVKMAWERVVSLGDRMLFVSNTTSLSAKKVIDGMENKVYFPRIQRKCGVFYSLDRGLYQTFRNDYSRKDLYETGEHLHTCWIEPKTDTYSDEELNWLANSLVNLGEERT